MSSEVGCSKIVLHGVLLVLLALLLTPKNTEQSVISRRLQRAISAESTTSNGNNGKPQCHGRTPCGWAVYKPFTRRFDYYMENTCDCPSGKVCLRTDDDLSVSAYVYTCRADTSSEKGTDNEGSPLT